jgi:RNA polymerase sigma factor (sigma-70 family)
MDLDKSFSNKAQQDLLLVERAKVGDEKAFAELMKRYQKPVYHMVLKMVRNIDDADDLTIEAFSKAFRNLEKYRQDFTFSTWLFRIATNNCIDFIRKRKLNTFSIDNVTPDSGSDETIKYDIKDTKLDPSEDIIKTQKAEMLQEIITKLPIKYQVLVRLRYFDELSYEEIAVEINAPLGTVKAQLHRAKELLFDMMKHKKDHL